MNEEVSKTLEILKKGGVILYPTDTIWGIGCDATNEEAVKRLFKIKKRPTRMSMLLLLDRFNPIKKYVHPIPDEARSLVRSFTKPTTIIYSKARDLPFTLIGKSKTIGIRITTDPFCKMLIKGLDKPVVSTSANFNGEDSPKCFDDISDELIQKVDYVVDWRRDDKEKQNASKVIKFMGSGNIEILRE